MRESFLHFVWEFQKFNPEGLCTIVGEPVQVYEVGHYNTDAGPDFLNAKIAIAGMIWCGHEEIHLKSSDWNRHGHQHDEAYNNVILHVVWESDRKVQRANGLVMPEIELHDRIDEHLILKCNELLKSPNKIPCSSQMMKVNPVTIKSMMDMAGVERLRKKSEFVLLRLNRNNGSWEETAYQMLAKNFGFKTNDESFLNLAKVLKYKIINKHIHSRKETEALIFGMAGFLDQPKDEYQELLRNEFIYLSKKYQLQDWKMLRVQWKYLRLRPANFPTVRLSQFAAFLNTNLKCFDQFIHFNNLTELHAMFQFEVTDYWKVHYDFNKKGKTRKGIGKASTELILSNTVAPLLAAYSRHTDNYNFMNKAVELMQHLKPEQNQVITMWKNLNIEAVNSFETQALLTLRNDFCLKKKCLSCKIGVSLLNR